MNERPLFRTLNKTLILVLTIWIPAILSCGLLGTQNPPTAPVLTSTSTAAMASPTSFPAATTAVGTPTLGLQDVWRISRIAFASNRSGTYQIYLMKPDGSNVIQLTDSQGENTSPVWSKDAKHIAFVSTRDGNSEIYVMNPDGTDQVNLTHDPSDDYAPVWIPNGRIVFVSGRGGRAHIMMMNADGRKLQSFYDTTNIGGSRKIICVTWLEEELVSFTVEGNDFRDVRLIDTSNGSSWTPSGLNGKVSMACPVSIWNSASTLYISNQSGVDQVYRYDGNQDTDLQLTQGTAPSLGPSWASDARWMTFYSKRDGDWDIYVSRIDREEQWKITPDSGDDIQPAWEPY